MSSRFNIFFKLASASMFAAVSLGARYGHVGQLDEDGMAMFQKGQLYNATNCLGLFACSMISTPTLPLKIAAGGFILGQLLFTAPIFYQAIKGRDGTFRMIIPVGGLAMMTSWLALIFA